MCSFDVMRNEACSQLVELRELKATSTAWVYRAISYVHAGQTHLVTGSFSTRIHEEKNEGTERCKVRAIEVLNTVLHYGPLLNT